MAVSTGHDFPHNIEAEQACLGACLIENEALDRVSPLLSGTQDFYRESHQEIYSAIQALAEKAGNIDLLTVTNQLREQGQLDSSGGPAYLDSLISLVQSSAHAPAYAQIVADRAFDRRMLEASHKLKALALDLSLKPSDKLVRASEILEAASIEVGRGDGTGLQPAHIDTAFDVYAEQIRAGTHRQGAVDSGFPDLDYLTRGHLPTYLIIIAGRTSMGKSACASQIAAHIARHYGPVLYITLEMDRIETAERVVCQQQMLDRDTLTVEDVLSCKRKKFALYIYDQGRSLKLCARRIRRFKHKFPNAKAVFVDYLGLLKPDKWPGSRAAEVSEIAKTLKGLAMTCRVPLFALHQVNRQTEGRDDKRPTLADLKDGGVEEDANQVIFTYRPCYYDRQSRANSEFILAKNRSGATGTVEVRWQRHCASFVSIAPEEEPEPTPKRIHRPQENNQHQCSNPAFTPMVDEEVIEDDWAGAMDGIL